MISYRIGFPGWKIAANLGMPLKAYCKMGFDKEARVFIAICDDFKPALGIGTEGKSLDDLCKKLQECFEEGIFEHFNEYRNFKITPYFTLMTLDD